MNKPKTHSISLIISAVERSKHLGASLRSLLDQANTCAIKECIVVTNDGDVRNELESLFHMNQWKCGLKIIHGPNLMSVAHSLDSGAKQATGSLLVFTDGHTVFQPQWLKKIATAFESDRCDVVFGRRAHLAPEDAAGDDFKERWPELKKMAKPGELPGHAFELLETKFRAHATECLTSNLTPYLCRIPGLVVTKEVFEKTSGFNPFFSNHYDIEFAFRLLRLNARFQGVDDLCVSIIDGPVPNEWNTHFDANALLSRHPFCAVLAAEIILQDDNAPFSLVTDLPDLRLLDAQQCWKNGFNKPLPLEFLGSPEQISELIADLEGLDPVHTLDTVKRAISDGLVALRNDAEALLVDYRLTHVWLDTHQFFTSDDLVEDVAIAVLNNITAGKSVSPFFSLPKTDIRSPYQISRNTNDLVKITCRGHYSVSIEGVPIHPIKAQLNIPVPIDWSRQTNVHLSNFSPPSLAEHFDEKNQMLCRIPCDLNTGEPTTFGYDFSFTVDEPESVPSEPHSDINGPGLIDSYSKHNLAGQHLERATRILRHLGLNAEADPLIKVRKLWAWVQEEIIWLAVPRTFTPFDVLNCGYGHCGHIMGLFVQICRLAGVPARTAHGDSFSVPFSRAQTMEFKRTSHGQSRFAHVWAEAYIQDRGWISFEIFGVGKRRLELYAMSPAVRDAAVRGLDIYTTDRLGDILPVRVYGSPRVPQLPTFPMAAPIARNQELFDKVFSGTTHTMSGTFQIY